MAWLACWELVLASTVLVKCFKWRHILFFSEPLIENKFMSVLHFVNLRDFGTQYNDLFYEVSVPSKTTGRITIRKVSLQKEDQSLLIQNISGYDKWNRFIQEKNLRIEVLGRIGEMVRVWKHKKENVLILMQPGICTEGRFRIKTYWALFRTPMNLTDERYKIFGSQ